VSCCGRYEFRGDTVVHRVELSLFPNWVGVEQERLVDVLPSRTSHPRARRRGRSVLALSRLACTHLKAVAILLSPLRVGFTCKPGPRGRGYLPLVPSTWMHARADEGSIARAALPWLVSA
jgi:hypothetical protein